jgi:hypothetical protein
MALVTTPGSASANSYASLEELNAYLAARVPAAALASGTDEQKEAALKAAARVLDASFVWTGSAVDSTQALTWPRNGMYTRNGFAIANTVNPIDLKNAQCELAAQMHAVNLTSDNEALKQGITSVKAGSVAVTFKEIDQSSTESADIEIRKLDPALAWAARQIPDAVRLLLVASWYIRESVARPLIFGAM